MQLPPTHGMPVEQAVPQWPQFVVDVIRSSHPVLQSVSAPLGHAHTPPTHEIPDEHAREHAPQFIAELVVS
jgi:hypothetical protein